MLSQNSSFRLNDFTGAGYVKGAPAWKQAAWLLVSSIAFRPWYVPRRLRVKVLRLFGASVGQSVVFKNDVRIHWPWKLSIGDFCWIGEASWFINLEPISIGSNTCVSQGVTLCTGSHDRRSDSFEFDNGPIAVGDHSWLALNSTILRGVTIGDRVTVGAGAVVRTDVADGELYL